MRQGNKPFSKKTLDSLYEGRLYNDSRIKNMIKILMGLCVVPYGLVSGMSAFGIYPCRYDNELAEAGCFTSKVIFSLVGMTAKILLLLKANYSILENIYPGNQVLPARAFGTRSQ